MDGPVFDLFLSGGLACIIAGIILTKRRGKLLPPEPKARVICSLCGGWLSGLEHFCPTCGKPLLYAVRPLPEDPPSLAKRKGEKLAKTATKPR